jgi:hypothetical protein
MINSIYNIDVVKIPDQRPQGKEKQPVRPPHEARTLEDKVSLEENPAEKITYGMPPNAAATVSTYSTLREMLVGIMEEQGITTRIASGDTSIDFSDLTPEKARELISEDGYLGVEQTSERIVQFALSVADSNPNRLTKIKANIDKGFQMAAEALGGILPDISMETYNAIMDKLDAWAESFDEASAQTDNHEELTATEP